MNEILIFPDRKSFRDWLDRNGTDSGGVWLLFGKKGGPVTLTAHDALEEALCYGWIDGVMQSIDDKSYRKYFARRTAKSNWSDKNKKLVQVLIEKGVVAQQGLEAVEQAKKNGSYTGLYLDAKSDATRQTRLEKILDRLNKNLKPM